VGNNLKKLRKSHGWTQEEAAKQFGLSKSGYIKIEDGDRSLKVPVIEQAARLFAVPSSAVISDNFPVPVVGEVGAGEMHVLFSEGQTSWEVVDPPAGASSDTVAARIVGDSLGRFFNGWYVFYNDVRRPFEEGWLNELCVVGLPTGQILVKRVERGSRRNRYNLVSQFGPPEYDVQIEWSARVIGIERRVPYDLAQPTQEQNAPVKRKRR
jgi:DNA-binding XRE family transcriptional regulator